MVTAILIDLLLQFPVCFVRETFSANYSNVLENQEKQFRY